MTNKQAEEIKQRFQEMVKKQKDLEKKERLQFEEVATSMGLVIDWETGLIL